MNTSSQHPLPSSLNVDSSTPTSQSALLHLDVEGLQVKYMGPGAHKDDAATIRTNQPVPPDSHLYYFEVHVASQGENGAIGVGFMAGDVHLACMPGWFPRSYGYHGDDGKRFGGDGCGQTYGPRFTTGDTVGALFSRADRSIHFLKNGQHLGVAFLYVEEPQLYPCVGFHSPGAEVELNLGLPDSRPFSMDLSTIVAASKQQVVSKEDYHMVTQLLAAVAEGNLRSIRNLVATCAAVAPAIVPAGAIPRLVELRVSAKPGVKHAAERVFGTLTLRPDTMPAIVRVAVAQLDIRVPRMASDIISAAEAVYMLAIHDTARAAIVQAGALPLLVTLLRGNSIAVKHATAVVLFDLAFNDAAKSAIVQEGAIPHLVALLQPSSHVRQHAALLLGKLAFDAATQSAIVQAGAVPHLTAMLADAPAKQIIAATVLDKLGCSSVDGASAISQAVQRLGGSGDDSVHWAAAVAAAAEPSSTGGSTSAIPRAEAVRQLLALLNSSDWSVQHAAGMALMTLGCGDAGIPKPVRQRISFFQHPDEQIEQLVDECVQIMQGDALLSCWWMPPEQLGTKYKHLGGGASAEVWLHMKGDLPVVVKHFSLATCDDGLDEKVSPAAVAKSFIVEVYNLARLARASNPNIVSLRGFTSSGPGQLAIVLEWVQGRTLADVLHEGDVPCATLWAWAMDIAQALSCLHSQQPPIVHRDLKPINIIIGMDGHSKLIDFGVSKQWMDRDVHGTATQFTPTWMPPELGKTAPVWTVKSDVYPFGLLLWHLLSKQEPFGGDEWGLLMGLVPRQLELPTHIHPALAQLIQECTCEAPEQRPDMSQVVGRLQALQDAFSLA